jgi:hypothetical protein
LVKVRVAVKPVGVFVGVLLGVPVKLGVEVLFPTVKTVPVIVEKPKGKYPLFPAVPVKVVWTVPHAAADST